MSTTGPDVVTEVYRLLQDQVAGRHVVDQDAIEQAVNRQVALVAQQLGLNPAWATSAITTAPGDDEYDLPDDVEYASVQELVYAKDRVRIQRVERDVILAKRSGGITEGRPSLYCVNPTPEQGLSIWFNTRPTEAEAIDALVSAVPSEWKTDDETAPTIPFTSGAVLALQLLVAAAVGVTLGEDRLVALGLNPSVFKDWRGEAASLIDGEALKIIRLKRRYGPRSYKVFGAWAAM